MTVAGLLHALADPVRAGIVRALLEEEDGLNCVEMQAKLKSALPKSTCSQHYRILRESGLIVSERKGVELCSRVRRAELEARFPSLLDSILGAYRGESRPVTARRR